MTTAETQHARSGRFGQAWRGFRRWRRARPFWGGFFTALAGLEIFGTTQMSLNGLTFKMGPTGFLTWLIPAILFTCGMLMWFSPPQRIFYAVVAAVTAVYSLIGVNLGGFFLGMLFGMVGSALGFAWVPARTPPAAVTPEEPVDEAGPVDGDAVDEDRPALVDELLPRQREEEATGPLTDALPEPRNPLREPAPTESEPRAGADTTQVLPAVGRDDTPGSAHRDPKLYAILLVLASVSLAGLLALRGEEPAIAAPAVCPTATPTKATPSPTVSASATPTPTKTSDGNLLTEIVDGITSLFTGGDSDGGTQPSPAPEPSTAAAAPAAAAAEPVATEPSTGTTGATPTESTTTSAAPKPSGSSSAPAEPGAGSPTCTPPAPTKPKPVEAGKPLPRLAPEPGQPRVANPSKLTGSKTTMTGLCFKGIVDLPHGDGTLRALKFTMDQAVTDDFVLQADGPANKTMRFVTDRLTVQGDVGFYATRFSGRLAGIRITLTPDLPLPDGIPVCSPLPITFTDPVVDLAFVDSKTLTAKPALKLDLA
ncbi:DUF6114 domain-containing protein [Micromonospora inositola]|uniref:Uncharacterized protein n=1 Tax=Micromonospora inositola TaxID=47865 RepID=A0A1C5I053_9ACTN|nr:DUF6114 domain-containing protein [Micromonospora inositola]SCG51612.1 hypothetical protein GA0070613_2067 [Micromonospora inositola]